jgi:hypothetical protein
MIERRKESRFRLSLPVRVAGVDDMGAPFAVGATATSLSLSGALLNGLEVELRCGDTLVVEYEGRRARFRIVWVLSPGPGLGIQVAIHKVNFQPCPWAEALPAEFTLASTTSEQR